jgi:hypothetical protein
MMERSRRGNPLRLAVWGGAALLLLAPWVAMHVTEEVAWSPGDFVVFGAMLLLACTGYELATRLTGNRTYRLAVGIALAGAFLLIWANLAVGIVGSEGAPVNLLFFAIPLVGIIGALFARFRPIGMARALVATAIVQVLAAGIALVADGRDTVVVVVFTGCYALLWLLSASLFRKAARHEAGAARACLR